MNRYSWKALIAPLLCIMPMISCNTSDDQANNVLKLNLNDLKKVGEVDERYQSFNVEMCEVVGGDFWIPYELLDPAKVRSQGLSALKNKIQPADLYNPKLRTLTAALGPTYIRVSGTWANTTFFQDDDKPKLENPPAGYENVLTRAEWKGVIDFCKAVDAKLVTSFAISNGIRDGKGNWTPAQMQPLVAYTKSIGGEIYAAEMFNEPSHAGYGGAPQGYNAEWYVRDFSEFRRFASSVIPEMKILGPGSTGEGGILGEVGPMSTDSIMLAKPEPVFDILSYHFYGGVSKRCGGNLTADSALTATWLGKTELGLRFYEEARNRYLPGSSIWLTETAEAACGGNPWASTYIDSFRYLEQLGRLAKKGVSVVMHNTLAASEYAILDQKTHDPRPNYWVALLWSRLMGTKVYDAVPLGDGIDVYAHSLKGVPGGLSLLIINTTDSECRVKIPATAEQYLISADELQSKSVKLNGTQLNLVNGNTLPEIRGIRLKSRDTVSLPAYGILFLAFEKVQARS